MTTKTISVARALADYKTLTKRIADEVSRSQFVYTTQGQGATKKVVGFAMTAEQAASASQSCIDRINALLKNQRAIRAAITVSNATTQITVAGLTMSVAEALELGKEITTREIFVQNLNRQLDDATRKVAAHNSSSIPKFDSAVANVDKAALETAMAAMVGALGMEVVNQKSLMDTSKKISTEIIELRENVNFAINESNVVTLVEVPA